MTHGVTRVRLLRTISGYAPAFVDAAELILAEEEN